MTNVLLEADSLTLTESGVECHLRLPWYRSLPLSVIRIDAVSIDGQDVATDALHFTLNGQTRPVSDLDNLTGEYWFVQDSMALTVGVAAAPGARLDVMFSYYPPYISNFRRKTHGTAKLKAA